MGLILKRSSLFGDQFRYAAREGPKLLKQFIYSTSLNIHYSVTF